MSAYLALGLGLLAAVGTSLLHPGLRLPVWLMVAVGLLGSWLGTLMFPGLWWETLRHSTGAATVAAGVTGGIAAILIAAPILRIVRSRRVPGQ